MSMRITGLATGLDIDQLVKDTMNPYRIKIQQVQQNKEIVEIKQKLYREVINESREFYNKYLDVAKTDSILLSKNWSNVKYTSADESLVSVKTQAGAKADNYTVDVNNIAKSAKTTLKTADIQNGDKITINVTINSVPETVEVTTSGKTNDQIVSDLNAALKSKGSDITATNSQFASGIVLETKAMGDAVTFQYSLTSGGAVVNGVSGTAQGQNANVTITNSTGTYIHTGNTNSLTLDGVQFTFSDVPVDGNPIRVTGKVDATSIKDKIVSFINDYNKLIEKMNTLTTEKRSRDFMPLTDEQKKEMSDDEIKLWDEKVKKGQLSRDSDITRISNQMKNATKSIFNGSLPYLEKIGINPVADYSGTKNGTFTIDEEKLTSALENSAQDVMKLFTAVEPTDETMTDTEKYSSTGIFQRIKTVLYDETVSLQSRLLKKVGIEGTSLVINNDLSKSIEKYERKMKDMESTFSRREQQLYSKFGSLESMMNKLNSQQSYLMSQLGMG